MWTVKVAVLLAAHVFLTDGKPQITKTEFKKNNIIVEWTGTSASGFEISYTLDGKADSGVHKLFTTENSYTIEGALQNKNFTITVSEKFNPQSNDTKMFQTPSVVRTTVGSTLTVAWPLSTTKNSLQLGYKIENMDTSAEYISLDGITINDANRNPSFRFNGNPANLTTTTNITISDVTTEFGGYIVSSYTGNTYGGIVLAVQGKPSKPSISGERNVEEGKDTILTCSSTPNTSPDYVSFPAITYHWLVDRSDALPAHFIESGSQLRITSVRKTDANLRINCIAYQNNTPSNWSEDFQLNVMYGPTTVILSPPSTTYTKYEGGTFGPISCTADCNPPCTIKWRVNASRSNGRFEDISTEKTVNNISVARISRNDTGTYRCIATANISGSNKSARKDAHLDVQYGPDHPVIGVDNLYVSNNGTIEKTENSTVKLDCSTESNPVSVMQWTRIRTRQNLTRFTGNMISHSLSSVQCEDSDLYMCSADNRVGVITRRQFRLQIRCAPRIKDRFQQTYGVKINSIVSVVIPVQGFPKPQFSWMDSQVPGGSPTVTPSNESSYRFVIHSTLQIRTSVDFKNYTFRIQNNIGENFYTITVIAKDRPIPPSNFSFGDVQTDSVNLTWISGFNGGSEQRFLIEQINPRGRSLVGNVSDPGQGKEVSFIVNNLLPKRRYTFQIISINTQGDTRNTSQMIVVRTKEIRIPAQASSVGAIAGASATVVVIIIALVVVFLVYSLRKKQIKKATDAPEQEVMYAAVNKPIKKKPQKAGPSGKQPDEDEGNLYANTADNAPLHYVSSNGANQKAEPVRTKNQDGLIYIDVEFQKPPKQGQGGPVIHGDESRTEYMQVDFNRRASPEAAEGDNSDE